MAKSPVFEMKRKLISGMLPTQRNVQVTPMPTFTHIDKLLNGTLRFSYAVGNNVASLVSRSTFTLFEAAIKGATTLTALYEGLEDISNCAVIIGSKETVIVKEQRLYNVDSIAYVEYVLEMPVHFNHVSGETCSVESFQVYRNQGVTFELGQTQLQLSSRKPICAGDQMALLVNTDFNAVMSNYIEFDKVTLDSYSNGMSNYTVELTKPLPYTTEDSSRLFIKAAPAYQSNRLPLVSQCSHGYLDVCHGKTFGIGSADVKIGVRYFDVTGTLLMSNKSDVNELVSFSSIKVHELACFNLHSGSVQVNDNYVIVKLDAEGKAALGSVTPKSYLSLAFDILCDGCKFIATINGISTTIDIESGVRTRYEHQSGDPVTSVIFRFVASPGSSIKLFNVIASQGRVHALEYSLVLSALPGEALEATGLIVKPFFKSTMDCREVNNSSNLLELNSGFIL